MNKILRAEGKKRDKRCQMTALVTMALLIMAPMNAFAAAQVQGKINKPVLHRHDDYHGCRCYRPGMGRVRIRFRLPIQRHCPADRLSEESCRGNPDVPGADDYQSSEVTEIAMQS